MSWSEIKKSLNSKLGTANDRALDVQLDELKTTVGATADAAGSATTGTVMGKLRWLIEQLTTTRNNVATNNTASATGILSQKLSWIGNTLIGATNNSGATATSGTVMGKLNGLLKQNIKYISWSEAPSGYTGSRTLINLKNIQIIGLYIKPSYYYYSSSGNTEYRATISVTVDGNSIAQNTQLTVSYDPGNATIEMKSYGDWIMYTSGTSELHPSYYIGLYKNVSSIVVTESYQQQSNRGGGFILYNQL